MPFLGPAIGAIGSIVGGVISARAARTAADQQLQATREAIASQERLYREGLGQQNRLFNLGREALAPYMRTGGNALSQIAGMYGLDGTPAFDEGDLATFRASPDYEFARQEGIRALESSNAAAGMLGSGNYLRDLTTFGQGLASQNYGNHFNRLMSIAGFGQAAASSMFGVSSQMGANSLGAAQNQGNALAQLALAGGQNRASGTVGAANAITGAISGATGAINSGANNLLLMQMMGQPMAFSGNNPVAVSPTVPANTAYRPTAPVTPGAYYPNG